VLLAPGGAAHELSRLGNPEPARAITTPQALDGCALCRVYKELGTSVEVRRCPSSEDDALPGATIGFGVPGLFARTTYTENLPESG
jgi:hypothetical protein